MSTSTLQAPPCKNDQTRFHQTNSWPETYPAAGFSYLRVTCMPWSLAAVALLANELQHRGSSTAMTTGDLDFIEP